MKDLVASDGTEWKQILVDKCSAGRRSEQNILREISVPTGHAKRHVLAGSPASAWRLLIDKFILQHIKKCTIVEAQSQTKSQNFTLNDEELEAFMAVIYAQGVAGKNDRPVHSLWNEKWGIPLCK